MHLKISFTEQQQYYSGLNVFDALNPPYNLELRPQPWYDLKLTSQGQILKQLVVF